MEQAFLCSLARPPTETEQKRLSAALINAGEKDKRAALEDVYWAVLSSKEFLFNH